MKKLFIFLGFVFLLGLVFAVQPATKVEAAAVEYTVKFTANGGTGEMASVKTGPTFKVPECTFGAPAGKEFSGWKVYGTTTIKQPGETLKVTKDTELVAQWKQIAGQGEEQGGSGEQSGSGQQQVTPAPTPAPQPEKKGCGSGAVVVASFGALALGAVILLKRKQF